MEDKDKSLSVIKEQIERFENFLNESEKDFTEKILNDVDEIKNFEQKCSNIEQELSSNTDGHVELLLTKIMEQQNILILQNRIRNRQAEILHGQIEMITLLLRTIPHMLDLNVKVEQKFGK